MPLLQALRGHPIAIFCHNLPQMKISLKKSTISSVQLPIGSPLLQLACSAACRVDSADYASVSILLWFEFHISDCQKHWAFIWIQLTGCDGPQDASCADPTSVYRISGCSYLQCAINMCTSTFSIRCESFDSLKYMALRCYCRSIYMALMWALPTSCHTILVIGCDQELPHYDSNC